MFSFLYCKSIEVWFLLAVGIACPVPRKIIGIFISLTKEKGFILVFIELEYAL
jgi:hypothetical protein